MKNQHPSSNIPSCTWSRPIGLGWDNPYTVRYASNLDDGPWHGMPLGGFGAGCFGRSPRGEFNLWHIDGGEHIFQTMPGCQFSVFEQVGDLTANKNESQAQAYTLSTESATDRLQSWIPYPASTSNVSTGTYHALYPRSWFVYKNVFKAQITCEQFSPILPHNYQDTSYPIAVFLWTVHNPTSEPLTLSILLSWENMCGWFTNTLKSPTVKVRDDGSPEYEYRPRIGESKGSFNQVIDDHGRVGCLLRQDDEATTEGDGQWSIATTAAPYQQDVFYHGRWNPAGDGSELWTSFSTDGSLPNVDSETPAAGDEQIGAAIAVRFTLAPGESHQIPFVVTWDFPITEFAEGISYYRRYTDFFGRSGTNAWSMVRTALKQYSDWQTQIQDWQQPILERSDLSDCFKMGLMNELYDLTSGGALWSAGDERDPIGQFAVLECLDYRWYESLDVRLYGSFALFMLWPDLDKSIMRAFARAIPTADEQTRIIGYYMTQGAESPLALRKALNATPHDLGAPNEHPWEKTNYTSYQDCNLWKDLPSDFVLLVYRNFVLTGSTDTEFLMECWPAVVAALASLKSFDQDNDGIPENSGAPDQTFDDWRLQGISAYCGALWIAALEAAVAIASVLKTVHQNESAPFDFDVQTFDVQTFDAQISIYQSWLTQSRPLYQNTLWNGQYYQLDSGSGSDVVMADQLCGQFYSRLLGLPDVVPEDCAHTALSTVYETCFTNFNRGEIGAANGLRPGGIPERPDATHPLEVWIGINFGLAAFLLQMGLKEQSFKLSETVIHQIYENGLQFRTPEAITAMGTFRACMYLRPMAIWLIYGVMTDFSDLRSPQSDV